MISSDSGFLRRMVYSDEYVYHVLRFPNTQDSRFWGQKAQERIANMKYVAEM